jgi:large subunit ribosomal protein L32e
MSGEESKSKERMMEIRKAIKKKKPGFLRQEYSRKKHRLGKKWRKPRGIHSKQREHEVARGALPSPGYGSPASVRGLDRQGCREVLVKNMSDMEKIKQKDQVAVIASGVGKKKRLGLLEYAAKNSIRVSNRRKFI